MLNQTKQHNKNHNTNTTKPITRNQHTTHINTTIKLNYYLLFKKIQDSIEFKILINNNNKELKQKQIQS